LIEAPIERTMTVPHQFRVVGADRSLWLDDLPLGYAYLTLGGTPLTFQGRRIIVKKETS
jgi:hypothetical protein